MSGVSGYQTVDVLGYNPTTKKLGLKVNGADTVIPFSGGIDGLVHKNDYSYTWPGQTPISFSISGVRLVTIHGSTSAQWDAAYLVESKQLICGGNVATMSGSSVTVSVSPQTGSITVSISGTTLTASVTMPSGSPGILHAHTFS